MQIKIQCPAKINLDLKVFPATPDGFHPIKSIMQTISLFDYLTITISNGDEIKLSGDSAEIPYNEKNICYSPCGTLNA
jgi:4-diphosphocytidyl-2-C-methyl-D-erythritol kinase